MKTFTLNELTALKTITVGQMDDLKVDTGTRRHWLSRMTKEDGAVYDNQVTVERYDGTAWVESYTYQALPDEEEAEWEEPQDEGYYFSGTGEWSEDSSYEDYLNR